MNLNCGLPCGFRIGNVIVKLNTSTSFWLKLSERLEKTNYALDTFEKAIESIEHNESEVYLNELDTDTVKKIYDKMLWFMGGGNDENVSYETKPPSKIKDKPKEKLISYSQDIDFIFSAFYQVYKIDLWEILRTENERIVYLINDLHFWKFLALLKGLPVGNPLVDHYIHYRQIDLSKLPTKTQEQIEYKKEIFKIKQNVALKNSVVLPGVKREKRSTYMDRKVRKMNKRGNKCPK